ncbi:MAG: DUF2088 domain-containing protein [Streptosporangiales bacterium]|nr:DUF2088 domain-containing protein [Streptosporangiales bacterium]
MYGPFAAIRELRVDAPFPAFTPVRQDVPAPRVPDTAAAVEEALAPRLDELPAGASVAVTAGSRGIADFACTVRAVVQTLRRAGAEPFVVPAMGSHGGATADGQRALLAELGVTEDTVGAPIRATMDTVELGRLPDGPVVHLDANAAAADAILLLNRVKPHTSFRGEVESGLAKIAAIGLGKQRGAEGIHAFGPSQLQHWIPAAYRTLAGTGKVLGGLALVENACHEVAAVEFLPADGIGGAGEAALLERARAMLPRLPFERVDVLVIDEFGKDKSGAGIDPNVIGRIGVPGVPELFGGPEVTLITAHHLTPASRGNATGIGLADFVPLRLMEQIDLAKTYTNGLTAGLSAVRKIQLPVVLPTDRDAVAAAVRSCGVADGAQQRIVRIRDTLALDSMYVSPALLDEVAADPALEPAGSPSAELFSADGDLRDW